MGVCGPEQGRGQPAQAALLPRALSCGPAVHTPGLAGDTGTSCGGGAGLRAAVTGSDSVPWGKLLLTGAALGAGSHVQSPRPSEDLAGADVPSAHECEDTGLVTSVRWPSVLGPAVWGGVLGGGGEVSHQRFRAEAAGLLEGLGERLPPQPACGHHARSAWAAQAYGHHARSAWAAQASWGNRPTEGPPRPR